ncbi:hypothetical protein N7534_007263 [Penicillium rubens]|nr:hypothetical protein N7534_007263 [Penicillium rubens]
MATDGMPFLAGLGDTTMDKLFARMVSKRTSVDWRSLRPPADRKARSGNPLRAVIAQVCGLTVPADSVCTTCAGGKGPFSHCRVLFVPVGDQSLIQWSWSCAGCSFNSNGNSCSFRGDPPAWLVNEVRARNPSDLRLRDLDAASAAAESVAESVADSSQKTGSQSFGILSQALQRR